MSTRKKVIASAPGSGDATAPAPTPPTSASPSPGLTPPPAPAPAFVPPTLGRDVLLRFPPDQLHQGVHAEAIGKVVKVLDAEAGTVNVKVFSPDGGADDFITGVQHASTRDALPADSPERNLPAWNYLSDNAPA